AQEDRREAALRFLDQYPARARNVVHDLMRLSQQRALFVAHWFELAQCGSDGVDRAPALDHVQGRPPCTLFGPHPLQRRLDALAELNPGKLGPWAGPGKR